MIPRRNIHHQNKSCWSFRFSSSAWLSPARVWIIGAIFVYGDGVAIMWCMGSHLGLWKGLYSCTAWHKQPLWGHCPVTNRFGTVHTWLRGVWLLTVVRLQFSQSFRRVSVICSIHCYQLWLIFDLCIHSRLQRVPRFCVALTSALFHR